jgi:membrane fusion protein (multidrug efflux system)
MLKRFLIAAGLILLLIGPVVGIKVFQIRDLIAFASSMDPSSFPVSVATHVAERQVWKDTLRAPGSIRAAKGIVVAAEIGGRVTSIEIENGAFVTQGQVLVRLDSSVEEAQLASAEAARHLAQINRNRAAELFESRTVSKADLDSAEAELQRLTAEVAALQSILDRKTIRAPFDGRVGIREVNLGQVLNVGDRIIPLQSLDPVFVDFNISQSRLAELSTGTSVNLTVAGLQGLFEGSVTAINPSLDEITRTGRVQATIPNPDEALRPGMFADVTILLPTSTEVIAIPVTAVQRAPYSASVFVVENTENGPVARKRFVRLGASRGDFVAVLEGLSEGDRVVSAGGFRLQPGTRLAINDAMQPPVSLTPAPRNS